MRIAVVLCLFLAGCGGGEPDPLAERWAEEYAFAEKLCSESGAGPLVVLDTVYSYTHDGQLFDLGLRCLCGPHSLDTPLARPGIPKRP